MKSYKIYNALTWIALLLSITAFTRLLQVLYTVNNFHKNEIKVSIFRNKRKLKESCKIKKNSLLDLSSKTDEKNLILIIDAYPVDNVYKEITGKESLLHLNLQRNSQYFINSISTSSSTPHSLAYILADIIDLKKGCAYPTFAGNFNPNFINSSGFFSKKNSFCSSRYKSINEFVKIIPLKFLSELPIIGENFEIKYREEINERLKNCSLVNDQIVDNMTYWIYKNQPEFKNYPLIFHDVYFHAKVLNFELYSEIDSLYSSFIMRLIKNLKKQKIIDNLIILSDHGPRLPEYNKKIRTNKELIELNRKGFFIYYFPLKEINENYRIAIEKKLK